MSHWIRWNDSQFNSQFASFDPSQIVFPNLQDGSDLVLATDYSGEHSVPEFRVLSFLLTTRKSVDAWDLVRRDVRKLYLGDRRRMSFKALGDALRINALASFLDAANHLNGVLLNVAVEKGFTFPTNQREHQQHEWTSDTFNKLMEICVFGATIVEGLRGPGQKLFWVTDDDSIVATEKARVDAIRMMGGLIRKYPGNEFFKIALGVASEFVDDDLRAEDLVAIPDLAAGAYSDTLTAIWQR